MAFFVAEQEEGEDYYVITLSFRPEGDYAGTPGQEQFYIAKEGLVSHRQVLALPRTEGQRRSLGIPVAVGLAAVAAAAIVGIVIAVGRSGGSEGARVAPSAVPPGIPAAAAETPAPAPTQIFGNATSAPTAAISTPLKAQIPVPQLALTSTPTFVLPTPSPTSPVVRERIIFDALHSLQNIEFEPIIDAPSASEFLEIEAGVSGWMRVQQQIDLARAVNAFRLVEDRTSAYLIGSVPVPGYGQQEDVHAFVHQDGWIVVYYFQDSSWARTIHWTGNDFNDTKLRMALSGIARTAGVGVGLVQYYDFRFPGAEKVVIALGRGSERGNQFQVNIPNSAIVFEQSLAIPSDGDNSRYSDIDGQGTEVSTSLGRVFASHSSIPPGVLSPGRWHIVGFTESNPCYSNPCPRSTYYETSIALVLVTG